MQSKATTVEAYLNELPEDRIVPIVTLRDIINENIPEGFVETMSYGTIGWVVPHALYPDGYHVTPKLPLPFINLASQKNFIALYHMSLKSNKEMFDWFANEYAAQCKTKMDMGKSCLRMKKTNDIPYNLIGELVRKVSVNDWIQTYESLVKKR